MATDKDMFTTREKEILDQISKAKSRKEIAGNLDLSIHTVDAHLRNIYLKTQTHSMLELFLWLMKNADFQTISINSN